MDPWPPKPYQMIPSDNAAFAQRVIVSTSAKLVQVPGSQTILQQNQLNKASSDLVTVPNLEGKSPVPGCIKLAKGHRKTKRKKSHKKGHLSYQENNLILTNLTKEVQPKQYYQNLEKPRLHPDELRHFQNLTPQC